MKCPSCQSINTYINESRIIENGQSVRRRRECSDCKYRFTTYERQEFFLTTTTKTIIEKKLGKKRASEQ